MLMFQRNVFIFQCLIVIGFPILFSERNLLCYYVQGTGEYCSVSNTMNTFSITLHCIVINSLFSFIICFEINETFLYIRSIEIEQNKDFDHLL